MRKLNRIIIINLGLLVINLFSQDLNQKGSFFVSTNPLKLIYGIVNIELEYQISPSVSIELGSEYVIGHYIIKKENHPDFVFRIGPRHHAFYDKSYGNIKDLFSGIFTGYTWSSDFDYLKGFNFGPEVGYKYKFKNPSFLNAKAFITSPYKNPKIMPGFECLYGYILKI